MFKLYEMKILGASLDLSADWYRQAVLNWSDKTQWVLNYRPIKPPCSLQENKLSFALNISDIAGRRMGSLSTGRCTATGCWSSPAGGRWSSPAPGPRISVRFSCKTKTVKSVRPQSGSQSISLVFICFDIPGRVSLPFRSVKYQHSRWTRFLTKIFFYQSKIFLFERRKSFWLAGAGR